VRSVLEAGFIFWGLFAVFAVIVLLYLLWMGWAERREAGWRSQGDHPGEVGDESPRRGTGP